MPLGTEMKQPDVTFVNAPLELSLRVAHRSPPVNYEEAREARDVPQLDADVMPPLMEVRYFSNCACRDVATTARDGVELRAAISSSPEPIVDHGIPRQGS